MNAARLRAARLAVFLECAGIVPIIRGSTYFEYCDFLLEQYCSLDLDLRWYARVEGRRRIREQGLKQAAIRLIPVPAPVCNRAKLTPDQRRRVCADYRRRIRQH